jgi:hypothetical protein
MLRTQADYFLGPAPLFVGVIKCFRFTDVHEKNTANLSTVPFCNK